MKNPTPKSNNRGRDNDQNAMRPTGGGSHAIRRRIRPDRIAVVLIPLVLIAVLIGSLCLYSCDETGDPGDPTLSATPVTQLAESSGDAPTDASTPSTDDDATTETQPATQEDGATTTTTTTTDNAMEGGQEIRLTADDVEQGNLIVINNDHAYAFLEDDLDLQYVYEQRNSAYGVSDNEVRLDAETMTQLNAMMADYQTETGNSNLRVFSGYRTVEDQQSRYDNGTSPLLAGCSDYHSGRTFNIRIDFADGTSDYYNAERYPDYAWIADHAAEYGFVQRYPAGKESITGDDSRGYTFRYVGVPHATYMAAQQLCLEEYVQTLQGYSADAPLEITAGDTTYRVYYVPAESGTTTVPVPDGDYTISGDNIGGFIVTYPAS